VINLWRDMAPGKRPPGEVTAIIEIPQGRVIADSIRRYDDTYLATGP
jgi:hypothetical protein